MEEIWKKFNKKFETQILPDEVLSAMALQNRYNFLNANFMAFLKDDEMKFLRSVEKFCFRFEKKNNIIHDEDFYEWIPEFGKEGYVSRMANFPELDINYEESGAAMDFMRALAVDQFDPQFNMAAGATVLCMNPVRHHHQDREACLQALKEMATGESVGCILITEPTKGSDSTHLDTIAQKDEEGNMVINGVKCYNTNAPKAKWAVCYGTATQGSDGEMSQNLINLKEDPGVTVERSYIPWVPRIYIGKETMVDTKVPPERILADIGAGKGAQFEGLVPERLGIAALNVAECWTAFSIATMYCNLRVQMGQEIIKHQAVGVVLTDYWAQICNMTIAVLASCRQYDDMMAKYNGVIPDNLNVAYILGASQQKYQSAKLVERCCYDLANLMGGAGVGDNTLMQDLMGISRIQEVVGGSRQIQQHVMGGFLRKLWTMSAKG